jgi:uncharacterized protein (TIGR03905 family)
MEIDMYTYTTQGTCSRSISFDITDEGTVTNVQFNRGCNGNTQGIAALVEGMPVKEVIAKLEGIKCGSRDTSCPDQLSKALKEALS